MKTRYFSNAVKCKPCIFLILENGNPVPSVSLLCRGPSNIKAQILFIYFKMEGIRFEKFSVNLIETLRIF